MAKKKKKSEIEVIEFEEIEKGEERPLCFNKKDKYCREELCGKWFKECKGVEDE